MVIIVQEIHSWFLLLTFQNTNCSNEKLWDHKCCCISALFVFVQVLIFSHRALCHWIILDMHQILICSVQQTYTSRSRPSRLPMPITKRAPCHTILPSSRSLFEGPLLHGRNIIWSHTRRQPREDAGICPNTARSNNQHHSSYYMPCIMCSMLSSFALSISLSLDS